MSIKFKLVWIIVGALFLASCDTKKRNIDNLNAACEVNWKMNYGKARQMSEFLSAQRNMGDYIALKQGATNHYIYSLAVITKDDESGYATVMTDYMDNPVQMEIERSLAVEILDGGKMLQNKTDGVNERELSGEFPCYFFQMKNANLVRNVNYVGRLKKGLPVKLLQQINAIIVTIETVNPSNEVDHIQNSEITKETLRDNYIWELGELN
ncbi:hypothetical protein [Glaciecola sp. SC05]|uniref:hypothetical protein n=1 Tax=Glaciecola sp. SC05 TaxID=1987355 RepID=UPI003527C92D